MKKAMLLLYRVVYGAFSALMVAVAVSEVISYRDVMAKSQTFLLALFACAAAFMLFATFAFRRLTVPLLWAGAVVFCGLYAWYGWYSLPAPFVQHETHTFDLGVAVNRAGTKLKTVVVNSRVVRPRFIRQ